MEDSKSGDVGPSSVEIKVSIGVVRDWNLSELSAVASSSVENL
jgi:hypothetical protein